MIRNSDMVQNGPVPVTLVTGDPGLKAAAEATFKKNDEFDLDAISGSVAENESQLVSTDQQNNIAIIDLDTEFKEDLLSLERIMQVRSVKSPLIVITETLQPSLTRELLRLHVTDWMLKVECQYNIIEACARACRTRIKEISDNNNLCYSFLPSCGGIGNTTLAIETAFLMAKNNRSHRSTCLVDLDFQGGAVADYLNVPPNLQICEIMNAPDRLDVQLLEVMLSRHESGMAILAAPNSFSEYVEISQKFILQLLDLVSAKFNNVVIDLPRYWFPWTQTILFGSDKVFIIGDMTVPNLRRAKALSSAVSDIKESEEGCSVIINRYHRQFGYPGLKRRDAEKMLGGNLAGIVPENKRLVTEAIDRGIPVHQINRSNKIDRALERILFKSA